MNELMDQSKRGALSNIEIEYNNNISNKQYNIHYQNIELNKPCQIIIGTIDSFMYTIGNKN